MKIFADRLKALQESRGLSQMQIAQLTGISQGTISDYLNDRKSPGLETAANIAEALGMSVGWLCGEPEMQTLRGHAVSYGQVLTILHELIDLDFVGLEFSASVDQDGCTVFSTADPVVSETFAAILQARTLYQQGALNREMYMAIVEKYIEKQAGHKVAVKGEF